MTVLLVLLLVYAAIVVAAALLQTKMLFPGSAGSPDLPDTAEQLTLPTPDRVVLHGVHLLPSAGTAAGGPVLLGFGGNAANADAMALTLHELYPAAEIVAFHYRGYGASGGRPSAAALSRDSLLIHDFAAARFPGRPIVAAGFSVGSGIAAFLASRRPLAGLILVTPFDSLTAVAAGHYPWLPVRLLFHHLLEPAEALARTRVPVAIVAGGADTLVPKARTDGLRAAVPNLVYDRTIPHAGHNDIYGNPAFAPAMREALARIAAAPSRPEARRSL
ncbi:MAG: hypothetical protein JWO81_2467 [Alphaproteobacteria bacterium]|nr:hypothetical protein [Alphaproteobacteria bacterium]